jgi:hypothetical protein
MVELYLTYNLKNYGLRNTVLNSYDVTIFGKDFVLNCFRYFDGRKRHKITIERIYLLIVLKIQQ